MDFKTRLDRGTGREAKGGQGLHRARTHIIWAVAQWGPALITSRLVMCLGWTGEVVFTHTQ